MSTMTEGKDVTGETSERFLEPQSGSRKSMLGMSQSFEILNPAPVDLFPPTKPHFLSFPKENHQLRTKHMSLLGDISFKTQHVISPRP